MNDKDGLNHREESEKAREIRMRCRYRRFLMRHSAKIEPSAVQGLIGPDCAFHLYRGFSGAGKKRPNG